MRRRMTQVERQIDDDQDRYSGWVGTIVPAVVAPNFTTDGFGLTRAPTSLVQRLKETLQSQLQQQQQQLLQQPRIPPKLAANTTQSTNTTNAKTFIEDKHSAIDAGWQKDNNNNQDSSWQRPWLILDEAVNHQVLEELRPMHEAWAGGISLKGATAYGIRVYRNQSVLHMHGTYVFTL
jgi:hypothetical protein